MTTTERVGGPEPLVALPPTDRGDDGQLSLLRNGHLLALGIGHCAVDLCANILPVFYPMLAAAFSLTYASVGALMTVQSTAASISQPLFGWLVDRFGSRALAPLSVLAAAAAIALVGFVPGYYGLLMVVAGLGLASGAWHPQGAKAATILGGRWRTTALSIYILLGTAGYASGPLLAAVVLLPAGIRSSVVLLVPSLLVGLLLLATTRRVDRLVMARGEMAPKVGGAPVAWAEVVALGSVIVIRAWVSFGILVFLPLLYAERGESSRLTGEVLFLVLLMEGTGTAVGGWLADSIGRRVTMVVSFLLLGPALHFFVAATGPVVVPLALATGLLMGASIIITLVAAQEMLPSRMGMASGIAISLNQIMGGAGVALQGLLADRYGLLFSMEILVVASLVAAGASLIATTGAGGRGRREDAGTRRRGDAETH